MESSLPAQTTIRHKQRKIATWAAIFIWIAGITASFLVPPSSTWIWLPDSLLLLGFLPLLVYWPFSWTWILFGLSNTAIGFFLLVISCLPDRHFPADAVTLKHHLQAYHQPFAWMVIGAPCTIYGVIRFLINMFVLMNRRG